ncbi:hypothetical protein AB0C02_32770 [Micromonospora sp. NPDC048999]|uniref:hypothetical protein n=1 Tax=Micromonospora sp. NPDC048999 TaxID=3155391 RepID=UPI0034048102
MPDRIDSPPQEVVVSAVAAPYTSFRKPGGYAPRLDYQPLQDVIERWPAYVPALAEELKPGRGYCDITVDEVDEAIRGLTSPHIVIRRHAVCLLGDRRLGAAIARRVLPLLGQTVSQDPDATVRRLAILSPLWWRKRSHRYANVVREALNDLAAEVREVAAYWLREQNARPAGRLRASRGDGADVCNDGGPAAVLVVDLRVASPDQRVEAVGGRWAGQFDDDFLAGEPNGTRHPR